MEFTFRGQIDKKTAQTISRVVRKTVNRKSTTRAYIVLAVLLAFELMIVSGLAMNGEDFGLDAILAVIICIPLFILGPFRDRINGFFMERNATKGSDNLGIEFNEDTLRSETGNSKTEWQYDAIYAITETEDLFVIFFSKNQVMPFDKKSITGGTVEEFENFIREKTGKSIFYVK